MNITALIKIEPFTTLAKVVVINYGTQSCKVRRPVNENCLLNYEVFEVRNNLGKKAPYVGAIILDRTDIAEIRPKENFTFSADIANEYMITAPIDYSVEYMVLCIGGGIAFSDRAIISASTLQILPAYQLALHPEEIFEGYLPNSHGINQSGLKFIAARNQSLIDNTVGAVLALRDTLDSIRNLHTVGLLMPYYNTFICHANDTNSVRRYYNYTKDVYVRALDYLQSNVEFSFNGTRCKKGAISYVYPVSPIKIIYLCDGFINFQTTPNTVQTFYTKMGSIMHEVAHKVSQGEVADYSYGVGTCFEGVANKSCDDTLKCFVRQDGIFIPGKKCASNNHSTNVYNADCIAFLAEAVYYYKNVDTEWHWYDYAVAAMSTISLVSIAGLIYRCHLSHHEHND